MRQVQLFCCHFMAYPFLPAEFDARYDSGWVTVPNELWDRDRTRGLYQEYVDQLVYAEELGFDGLVLNEHHQNIYGLMPSPNLIATALARRTTNTAICVLGNSLALYNPPTRVAEEFAMIDCISGGRLIAGFPVGTPMDTTYAYGTNPSQLRERYYEAHDLVLRAWTEKDTFAFNGRSYVAIDQAGAFGAFTDTLDLLIDITGVTGTVATGSFTT